MSNRNRSSAQGPDPQVNLAAIVTHNVRDFAGASRFAVNIVIQGALLTALE
jgi:hypothetical protein